MRKYLYGVLILAVFSLLVGTLRTCHSLNVYKAEYERELNNIKAYAQYNDSLNTSVRQFRMTIDELEYLNDSINNKLLETTKELKIKEKNLKYLQYQVSLAHKTDTIKIGTDTIFKEIVKEHPIDTTIGDYWYNLNLKLNYPSTIVTTPQFRSEKHVIISAKKEYVNKPSKIFFIRWFQKKRTVVAVDIIEKNPYIDNKENRFIEVVQ